MTVTTVRLDETTLRNLDRLAKLQKVDRSTLIKKAVDIGIKEIFLEDAIEKYQSGKCSAWYAAKNADLTLWEFLEELQKRKIFFRTDEMTLEKSIEEI